MGTDLRIYKETVNYNFEKDLQNITLEQVGETIHDVNIVDQILDKKEWGVESEGNAIAEVYGQHIIDILLADTKNKYTTDNIEEDLAYRVQLSY